MKALVGIVVIAGLVYGAYLVNENFLGGKKEEAPELPPIDQMAALTLVNDVPAYDPANPENQIGLFLKGTEVRLAPTSPVPGMKHVYFAAPNGQMVQAVCKDDDLNKPAAIVSEPLTPMKDNLTIAKDGENVESILGKKKDKFGASASAEETKKEVIGFGKSPDGTKTIGQTFQNNQPPPSTAPQSPSQNIKQRAKDLQKMQPEEPAP